MEDSGHGTKICPDCSCDYLPHVETCVNCGTVLLFLEEHARREAERKACREKSIEDPVAVREGELRWIDELGRMLADCGVPSRIHTDPGCGRGCRETCRLLVSRKDAERAHHRIEEYFTEVHPEARRTEELLSQGRCPACGAGVTPATVECPDCGLTLLIVE